MNNQEKDYSWLLVVIVLGLAVLGSMGCKGNGPAMERLYNEQNQRINLILKR